MIEKIINLFPIFKGKFLTSIGFRVHKIDGTDDEKIEFLKSRIDNDLKEMVVTLLPENFTIQLPDGSTVAGLTLDRFNGLLFNGTDGILYEAIFQAFNFPSNPLQVVTPIVDGAIKFDKSIKYKAEIKALFTTRIHEEIPKHYLDEFMTDKGFALVDLIDKDFFGAIKLTYNQGHFVSCLKLLLSAVDSMAFLEFGDIPQKNIFKDWLTGFCDFSSLNITEVELLEYRNSLLHMTNAYSRKVAQELVKRLQFYVSKEDKPDMLGDLLSNYFNIKSLIQIISDGIDKWAESFNKDKNKIAAFLDRYDLIISDSRYNKLLL